MKNPQVYDAEFRVIQARAEPVEASPARIIARMISVSPILLFLIAGAAGLCTSKTAVLGAICATLVVAWLRAGFNFSRLLPARGTLMILIITAVVIAVTGCSGQANTSTTSTNKTTAPPELAQYQVEVEQLQKDPKAFEQALQACGKARTERVRSGQLGTVDYRCSAIANAYYSQPAKGAAFQGGSLDYDGGKNANK